MERRLSKTSSMRNLNNYMVVEDENNMITLLSHDRFIGIQEASQEGDSSDLSEIEKSRARLSPISLHMGEKSNSEIEDKTQSKSL